jgi:YgiT-type zinc finger domain-containing protein
MITDQIRSTDSPTDPRVGIVTGMATEYGRCPCSGRYERRLVDVHFNGGQVVLPNVPQGACPVCGSRVYNSAVLGWIEAAFLRSRQDDPSGGSGEPAGTG